jgi:hypothetical protein
MHRDDHYRLCAWMVCARAHTAGPILNQQENQSLAVLRAGARSRYLSGLTAVHKILPLMCANAQNALEVEGDD